MRLVRIHVRSRRVFILAWTLGAAAYLFMIGSVYSNVAGNEDFARLWESYPEELKAAFGGVDDITTVNGFLEAEALSYLPLVLGIVAVMAATKGLSGAEESGALDHALARPVRRRRYIISHLAAVGVLLGGILFGALVGVIAGFAVSRVEPMDLGRTALAFVEQVPIALLFLGVGAFFGALFHRSAPATGTGVTVVLASYAVSVIARVTDASWLEFATPFGLLERSNTFHGRPDLAYFIVCLAAAGALLAAAIYVFDNKDLHA